MTPIERIDQYLDKQLPADEAAKLERDLQQNADLRALLDSVDMTRRMVRTQTIRADVRRVHADFIATYRQQSETDDMPGNGMPTRVVPLDSRPAGMSRTFGWVVRIAATVLLAVVGYGGYQLATLSGQAVYDDTFVAYQLPTTRDTDRQSGIDSLYRATDYKGVVEQVTSIPVRQQQPRQQFLAALSYLQLRRYDAALAQFGALRSTNSRTGTPYFGQESDYYEALAHLGAGHYDQAHARLDRIHANPRHLFHPNVSGVDLWKLKLLTYR